MATAHELQDRLSPRTIARGAWQGAKGKSADLQALVSKGQTWQVEKEPHQL